MPSELDTAKRVLVSLLKALAAKHKLALLLSRESSDAEVRKAFKKVALRSHPDKGGNVNDFQELSAANDEWQNLTKDKKAPGRPPKPEQTRPTAGRSCQVVTADARKNTKKEYRVQSSAVLLTYQGLPANLLAVLSLWLAFVELVEKSLKASGVKLWACLYLQCSRRPGQDSRCFLTCTLGRARAFLTRDRWKKLPISVTIVPAVLTTAERAASYRGTWSAQMLSPPSPLRILAVAL